MNINESASEQTMCNNSALEAACEAALQMGHCGVRAYHSGMTLTAYVDPKVPYGQIWENY